MSAIHHNSGSLPSVLQGDNVRFGAGSGKGLSMGLMGLGAVLLLALAGLGFSGAGGLPARHVLASFHIGVMSVLAICLGATFFVMVFHLLNAGWTSTLRRQFENVMAFLPVAWGMLIVLFAIEFFGHGLNFGWLKASAAHDHIFERKAGFFFFPGHPGEGAFPVFFAVRTLLYGALWFYLTHQLRRLSQLQDESGDVELSARARFMCAWGMPVFALSIAFCSFDYLMSVDFKFFSTMWGVYYFAGSAFSGAAVVSFILVRLTSAGKCRGVITSEHMHDMGKLMFSFTVFWAYISFCQYFLYWYANIPEETAFFLHRTKHWDKLGAFLMIAHFGIPFLFLVSRHIKKNPALMTLATVWFVLVHVADIYWIVRPMVYSTNDAADPGLKALWVDLLGIAGVFAIFAGFVARKVTGGVLVALRDPYMHEGLEHKNYV